MAKVSKRTWKTAEGEARQAWRVDFTDASGTRQRRQFAAKKDADAFRVDVEGKMRAGTFRADAEKVTVRDLAVMYLEYARGRQMRGERFSRRNYDMVEGRLYNYICPDPERAKRFKFKRRAKPFTDGIAHIKLSELTSSAVNGLRDRLRSTGLSVPTTRKIISTVHAMLEFARTERELLTVNVAHGVKVIGTNKERSKKIVPPSKEALRALIDVADPDFRIKIIFAAATGLRAGEFHALRWHHIDLDEGEVVVKTRVDDKNVEDLPKTTAGERTVPIGATVIQKLREWKLRSKWSKPNDLVFPNRYGRYVRHTNMIQDTFYPLFKKCEGVKRFNWHSLRHFAVSTWIEAGLTPKTIQTFAGHSSLAMTMNTYGHLFPSDDHAKAMDAIAKGLFG